MMLCSVRFHKHYIAQFSQFFQFFICQRRIFTCVLLIFRSNHISFFVQKFFYPDCISAPGKRKFRFSCHMGGRGNDHSLSLIDQFICKTVDQAGFAAAANYSDHRVFFIINLQQFQKIDLVLHMASLLLKAGFPIHCRQYSGLYRKS